MTRGLRGYPTLNREFFEVRSIKSMPLSVWTDNEDGSKRTEEKEDNFPLLLTFFGRRNLKSRNMKGQDQYG